MESAVLIGWNTLLKLVDTVFNVVFFWLPDDPLTPYLASASVSAANEQAVRWLNWFVDVSMFSSVFAAFVGVLLLFAAFKVLSYIVKFVLAAVDAAKPV